MFGALNTPQAPMWSVQQTSAWRVAGALGPLAGLAFSIVGCGASPEEDARTAPEEGSFSVDASAFLGDAPAIAARWYDYDASTHTLSPAAHRYVLRDDSEVTPTYAAFRITHYYDPDTAASGRFAAEVTRYDQSTSTWNDKREWVSSHNVREDGPLCVDFFAAVPTERDCSGTAWQVQFRTYPLLIPEANLVVGNPGVFIRTDVDGGGARVATIEGAGELRELGDPGDIEVLESSASATWNSVSYDRSRFSPNLPRAGMALGARFADAQTSAHGDVFFMLTPRQTLVRFVVRTSAEEMTFSYATSSFDPEFDVFRPFGLVEERRVAVPDRGETTLAVFASSDESMVVAEGLTETSRFLRPDEKSWDVAIERTVDGVQLLLSPSVAIFNHTAEGGGGADEVDGAHPPGTD